MRLGLLAIVVSVMCLILCPSVLAQTPPTGAQAPAFAMFTKSLSADSTGPWDRPANSDEARTSRIAIRAWSLAIQFYIGGVKTEDADRVRGYVQSFARVELDVSNDAGEEDTIEIFLWGESIDFRTRAITRIATWPHLRYVSPQRIIPTNHELPTRLDLNRELNQQISKLRNDGWHVKVASSPLDSSVFDVGLLSFGEFSAADSGALLGESTVRDYVPVGRDPTNGIVKGFLDADPFVFFSTLDGLSYPPH